MLKKDKLESCWVGKDGQTKCKTKKVETKTFNNIESGIRPNVFKKAYNSIKNRYDDFENAGNIISKALTRPTHECEEKIMFHFEDGEVVAKKKHECKTESLGEKGKDYAKEGIKAIL